MSFPMMPAGGAGDVGTYVDSRQMIYYLVAKEPLVAFFIIIEKPTPRT